jgi:hypothetical protein
MLRNYGAFALVNNLVVVHDAPFISLIRDFCVTIMLIIKSEEQ